MTNDQPNHMKPFLLQFEQPMASSPESQDDRDSRPPLLLKLDHFESLGMTRITKVDQETTDDE